MTVEFRLPDLGEGVAESEIVRWLVAPGEQVTEDQPMVEVMTDKATVEIPAPATSVVQSVRAAEGDVVPVGTVIVEIAPANGSGAGSAAAAPAPAQAPAAAAPAPAPDSAAAAPSGSGARVQATPLVRRLAAELGVDLSAVTGSGPQGRITEADVRGATGGGATGAPEAEGAATRRVPLRGIRRMIAEHLTAAQRVPTVTVVEECDLTALEQARAQSGVGYLPYVVRAVVSGLREVPELNATLDESASELVVHERVDMGIAVQADEGLVVPVLRDCADMSLEQVEQGISSLADAARDGSLTPEQTRGGTFTITSAGRFGGLFTTPLLNVPQVGILGLHRADDRPVAVDGEVVVRRMANVSVSFDHRALDGIAASRFLLHVVASLQAAGDAAT